MKNIHIHLSEEVADSLHMPEETLNAIAREALLVRLYAMGKIDVASAAEMLGGTVVEFCQLLKQYEPILAAIPSINGNDPQSDKQTADGDEAQPSSEHEETAASLKERGLAVLREAGLLVDPNEYPLLKQIVAEGPIPTLEEVQDIFARNPGKSLSEIVIEQRGPLY